MRSLFALLLVSAGFSGAAFGASKFPGRWLATVGASYGYTNSLADGVVGANYSERYTNPVIGEFSFGGFVVPRFYLGAQYEYWYARRVFSLDSTAQTDQLNLQMVSAQLGYGWGNPRVLWLLTASVGYPLVANVSSTAGAYAPSALPLGYEARAYVMVLIIPRVALTFSGGYRIRSLGRLYAGATPYLSGGDSLDLSGAFGYLGVAFSF